MNAKPTARVNLPRLSTSFVGREEELTRWTERLRKRGSRVYTLAGPGGSGKSRLALQLAARLTPEFSDGVCWVDLVEAVDTEGMRKRIVAALGLEPSTQQTPAQQLISHLGKLDLLLILDNTEQIQDAGSDLSGGVLSELIQATERLVLLVTTRRAPTLAAQQRLEVAPLSLADAAALFEERARAVRDDFARDGPNAEAVDELCARLEGTPLAIELAAARVDTLSPREILRRLQSGFGLLRTQDADVPERFRTLRTTIEWSYHLLTPDLRTVLSLLTVFAGGFTGEAAAAVCGEQIAEDGLAALCRHSLLRSQTDDLTEENRYRMLEVVREFAMERLAADRTLEEDARNRHAAFYLELGECRVAGLGTDWESKALTDLFREWDNLHTALRWAEGFGNRETGARLAVVIYPAAFLMGYWNEAAAGLEAALRFAPDRSDGGDLLRARLLFLKAWLERERGRLEEARPAAEKALELQRAAGDREGSWKTLCLLCGLNMGQGELDDASRVLDEMEPLIDTKNHLWRGNVLHNRACIADLRGETDSAWSLNEEALRQRRLGGHTRGVAESLCNLGALALKKGDLERAGGHYRESLRLRQELDDRPGEAIMLFNLAEVGEVKQTLPAAIALYCEAERRMRALQSVYAAAATEAITRLEGAHSPEAWRELVKQAGSQSWEAWVENV